MRCSVDQLVRPPGQMPLSPVQSTTMLDILRSRPSLCYLRILYYEECVKYICSTSLELAVFSRMQTCPVSFLLFSVLLNRYIPGHFHIWHYSCSQNREIIYGIPPTVSSVILILFDIGTYTRCIIMRKLLVRLLSRSSRFSCLFWDKHGSFHHLSLRRRLDKLAG